eukprot:131230-Amphidinium_carterae.1
MTLQQRVTFARSNSNVLTTHTNASEVHKLHTREQESCYKTCEPTPILDSKTGPQAFPPVSAESEVAMSQATSAVE